LSVRLLLRYNADTRLGRDGDDLRSTIPFFIVSNMDRFLQMLGLRVKNILSQSNENDDDAVKKDNAPELKSRSHASMALENIRPHIPDGVKITAPDCDVGNIAVASYIGEYYTSVFPFLVACRGATLNSECRVYAKKDQHEKIKRAAEILQKLGAIEITRLDDNKQAIYFVLRDTILLEHRWIAGYTAKILTKNFQGMPLQYVLHAYVKGAGVSGSFDALALSGKTLFAIRLVTMMPNEQFFERLRGVAEALDLPDSKIVLPVLPQPEWHHIVERLRRCGYAACELGSTSDVLQRLRREEADRHKRELRLAATAR
jgi:hypothetical protein